MQGLELWNKERAILEIGKMKSPIGYQEIRPRAWERSERLSQDHGKHKPISRRQERHRESSKRT